MDHKILIVDDDPQQRRYLSAILYSLGYGAATAEGEAPFDRILISAAAADDTPAMLLEQLCPGGIVVLPVGQTDEVQQLIKIEKTEDGPSYGGLCDVLFVPLIEGLPEDIGH